ncbi:hypothetical protein [Pseudomonas syringae]|uniref:hypothetical protein n=1 Tax=Pseudomonas syringae TaxID=317 RepID=UPI0011B66DBF|nr:hypothetical protein [Pseudomonas syringae]
MGYEESFQFSEVACASLSRINEQAMIVMRERAGRPHPAERELGNHEEEAAIALYDAILMNLPNLTAGEALGHAFGLSKALYQTVAQQYGERPGFDAASNVICVQDYRAMMLAGRSIQKL